jgi:hypothetical protein
MRELHAWHGDRRHAPDAGAENSASPARDAPRHEVLRDPAARVARHLEYRSLVAEAEAAYTARHRRPGEARAEHAPAEARDGVADKIGKRWEPLEDQKQKRKTPERSRLPSNETAQLAAGVSIAVSSVADAVNVLPGRWDAVAVSVLGAVAAGIAWGNKRWKDKHGHRPED